MKFIAALIVSYASVALYMALFNPNSYAWVPFVFIILMLAYYYADSQYTWWLALMAGLFTDMQYQYLGPYLCIFAATVGILHWLEGIVSPRQHIASLALLVGVASIWYVLSLFFVLGVLNGFHHYYHGASTIYQLLGIIACAWIASLVSIAAIRGILFAYRYARG
jgi:hypothetical protein